MASRHLSRALVLQTLFECDLMDALNQAHCADVLARNATEFDLSTADVQFAKSLLTGILSKREEVDAVIIKAAPSWPLEKIAPVDRNVLRLGLYELLFGDRSSVPPKVALNEAIEIAKSFGGDASGKFVNGVLGAVYRDIGEPQKVTEHLDLEETHCSDLFGGVVVIAQLFGSSYVALVHDAFQYWTLPKSRTVDGELSRSAAERALKEELGLESLELTQLTEHMYIARDPDGIKVPCKVGYFTAVVNDRIPLNNQQTGSTTDARWFKVDELDAVPLYADLRKIIHDAATSYEAR